MRTLERCVIQVCAYKKTALNKKIYKFIYISHKQNLLQNNHEKIDEVYYFFPQTGRQGTSTHKTYYQLSWCTLPTSVPFLLKMSSGVDPYYTR